MPRSRRLPVPEHTSYCAISSATVKFSYDSRSRHDLETPGCTTFQAKCSARFIGSLSRSCFIFHSVSRGAGRRRARYRRIRTHLELNGVWKLSFSGEQPSEVSKPFRCRQAGLSKFPCLYKRRPVTAAPPVPASSRRRVIILGAASSRAPLRRAAPKTAGERPGARRYSSRLRGKNRRRTPPQRSLVLLLSRFVYILGALYCAPEFLYASAACCHLPASGLRQVGAETAWVCF